MELLIAVFVHKDWTDLDKPGCTRLQLMRLASSA